ncbi:MAG: hypothetical protein IJA30_07540 [Bacilli bacterium]|nr:hypothetical protein [Bacilli bacterium]
MKKIEIYNYDTNDTFAVIETNKKKYLQKEVINYLKSNNFNLIVQGRAVPFVELDVYWLAYNKDTGEKMKLWYREAEKEKTNNIVEKDITDDRF